MTNPGRPSITALIHTRNESRWIEGCLQSVSWADEIVVADMASTDDTREKAVKLGARIIEVPVVPNVDMVRNQALAACQGDWILVVDADERVSPGLAARVRELASQPTADAYGIPRRNYFFEEWMEHILWPDHQNRFFRRGAASWSGVVHENAEITGRCEQMPADPAVALEHPGCIHDIPAYFQKALRYGQLEVTRWEKQPVGDIWPLILRRPLGEFIGRYFISGGWRHGTNGLILSLLLAHYQFVALVHYWASVRTTLPKHDPVKLRRSVRWQSVLSALRVLRR